MHPVGTLVRFIWRNTKRAVIMVVGVALLIGGLIMLVTPGPGIVVIIAGLAILATEFIWAERMLDKAKAHAATATEKVPGGTRLKAAVSRLWPGGSRREVPLVTRTTTTESVAADGHTGRASGE